MFYKPIIQLKFIKKVKAWGINKLSKGSTDILLKGLKNKRYILKMTSFHGMER